MGVAGAEGVAADGTLVGVGEGLGSATGNVVSAGARVDVVVGEGVSVGTASVGNGDASGGVAVGEGTHPAIGKRTRAASSREPRRPINVICFECIG